VWSVTSYSLLHRDALACERYNRLHPESEPRVPYIVEATRGVEGPFIAASDYMKTLGDLVSRFLPGRFVPLGTDGFGMSDTREALRRHFEIDAENIAVAALDALRHEGKLEPTQVTRAIHELGINPDKVDPMSI
jgi:pyruvate dehydrogenase E1 component